MKPDYMSEENTAIDLIITITLIKCAMFDLRYTQWFKQILK